jgi:HemK-like putative methylase
MGMWHWIEAKKRLFSSLSLSDLQLLWQLPQQDRDNACLRLNEGYPLEYLLKEASFGPLTISICEPLLIPRPETWDWLEQFLPSIDPRNVLDLGCGPGTLGSALGHFHPYQCALTCIDINDLALSIAQKNLEKNLFLKLTFLKSDWFASLPVTSKFDLIMTNPPYCSKEELSWMQTQYEDPDALFSAFGGLEPYFIILSSIFNHLSPKGLCIMEHGASQGGALVRLMTFFGIKQYKPWYDKLGIWRATSFHHLS